MTTPTSHHLNQLINALLDAFDYAALNRLTRIQLDTHLEWLTPVAGKRDLTTIVTELVAYFASQEDGLKQLLVAALQENPSNHQLNALSTEWANVTFAPIDLPDDHPAISTVVTDEGAYIEGTVQADRDFIGRDKVVQGDEVYGDKIVGDKVIGDKHIHGEDEAKSIQRFWVVISALIIITILGFIVLWIARSIRQTQLEPTPTASPTFTPTSTSTPAPTATPTLSPMTGKRFNIAIADIVFDRSSEHYDEYAEFDREQINTILKKLESDFDQHENFAGDDISIKHIDRSIDVIDKRHEQVRQWAPQLKSDVIIYGNLNVREIPRKFQLEFYIPPDLLGAEELTGVNAFGQPLEVRFPLSTNTSNRVAFNEKVEPIINTLAEFLIGLALFKGAEYDAALSQFELVNNEEVWTDHKNAQAVVSLWIGSTYYRLALEGAGSDVRCIVNEEALSAWDCMLAAYQLAADQNPTFARAYIGQGNYWLYRDQQTPEWADGCFYFPSAVEKYQRARELVSEASSENKTYNQNAYVPWKIDYNIGLAYAQAARYQPTCDPPISPTLGTNSDLAIKYLSNVLTDYDASEFDYKNASMARDLASRSAYQLGIVYRYLDDYQRSLENFQKTIMIATPDVWEEDWQSIRWITHNQIGKVYEEMAKNGAEGAWSKAQQEYDAVIDVYRKGQFGGTFNSELETVAGAYLGLGRVFLYSSSDNLEQKIKAIDNIQESITVVLSMEEHTARNLQDMPLVNYNEMHTALERISDFEASSYLKEALELYDQLISRISSGEQWRQPELLDIARQASEKIHNALAE